MSPKQVQTLAELCYHFSCNSQVNSDVAPVLPGGWLEPTVDQTPQIQGPLHTFKETKAKANIK